MNLKEAFRYQNFLESTMLRATQLVGNPTAAVNKVRLHKRHAANPDVEDISETVDKDDCYKPADVIALMERLITERRALSTAINAAKAGIRNDAGVPFDMDAALDTVKFQRAAANGLRTLLSVKTGKTVERGTDYKFNAEGNQVPYVYEVETTVTEDFVREDCRATLKKILQDADTLSTAIEKVQVETAVQYKPPFDVNDDFDDILRAATVPASEATSPAN